MPELTEKLGRGSDIEGIIHECEKQFSKQDTITILHEKGDKSTRLYIQGPKLLKKAGSTTLTSIQHMLPSPVEVRNEESYSALLELIEGLKGAGYISYRVAPYDGSQGQLIIEPSQAIH